MWTNVLQTMVDVIKYALIILVHISVVAIKDTSQMGNAAKVQLIYPENRDIAKRD